MRDYEFNAIEVGLSEQFDVTVLKEMVTAFCRISGDTNPLHLDSEYARFREYRESVVYGMLTSSFYSTLVGVYLPGKYALLQKIDIRFNNPVFIGDRLNVSGVISYVNDALRVIEVKARVLNQDREKVSSAKITVGLLQ